MNAFVADVSAAPLNGAHDLQARLYREIGVAAVAAALGFADPTPAASPSTPERMDDEVSRAA